MSMQRSELLRFLETQVEPLHHEVYGKRYRAAVYLKDGTYLPCVVFQSRGRQIELACRRINEIRGCPEQYRFVVAQFVSNDCRLADDAIDRAELSPFAWPVPLLESIQGETALGWTAFVVEMDDGRRFSYGTSFGDEFFDLPEGYSYSNIRTIHRGMIQTEDGRTVPFNWPLLSQLNCRRERQYFTCYLDELDPPPTPKQHRWNLKFW